MKLTREEIGTAAGEPVHLYTLENSNGYVLKVMNYGATVLEFLMPNKEDIKENVLVGGTSLNDYVTHRPFHGSTIGPVAGRIGGGQFELDDRTIQLDQNEGENHLHGGSEGWDTEVWEAKEEQSEKEVSVRFTLHSSSEHSQYPGNVIAHVWHTLTDDNEWKIRYEATTDEPTLLNPTNHVYFNLSGENQPVLTHMLQVNAEEILPLGEGNLPTGEKLSVSGTPFDFREARQIAKAVEANHPQIQLANGLDHPFLIQGQKNGPVATLDEPSSGRKVEVFTDRDAVVIYTHNHEDENLGISPYSGITFETQMVPNAVHLPSYRDTVVVTPEKPLSSQTTFLFKEA